MKLTTSRLVPLTLATLLAPHAATAAAQVVSFNVLNAAATLPTPFLAAAPEPGSAAMWLAGLGVIGPLLRRRV